MKEFKPNFKLISVNRLDHLENKGLDNGHLSFEEAVITWKDLGIKARSILAYRSDNDIDLILNIYREYYSYNIDHIMTMKKDSQVLYVPYKRSICTNGLA